MKVESIITADSVGVSLHFTMDTTASNTVRATGVSFWIWPPQNPKPSARDHVYLFCLQCFSFSSSCVYNPPISLFLRAKNCRLSPPRLRKLLVFGIVHVIKIFLVGDKRVWQTNKRRQ